MPAVFRLVDVCQLSPFWVKLCQVNLCMVAKRHLSMSDGCVSE